MKKIDRQGYLALLTFMALLILTAVQVNWLFRAATLEEQNFNHLVSTALKESRDEIAKRVPECKNMENYLCGKPCKKNEQQKTVNEIDSILRSQLDINHIKLNYTFQITGKAEDIEKKGKWFKTRCYLQNLNGLLETNGIQLALQFPDRNQFILAQIKGAFTVSILAIAFVMFSFIMTFRLFKHERELMTQTTDFINNMVHEFQTPIANIKLATGLIRKRTMDKLDERTKEYTDVILKESHKLQTNVEEILHFSDGSTNNQTRENIDIHEIIRSAADDYLHRFTACNGTLMLNLEATNSLVRVEKNHLSLIFSNLLDNAVKYSTENPEIEIGTFCKTNRLYVKIRDNGMGISKSDQHKIFDRYYRVHTGNTHNVKGFGLGLTFVKRVITDYHGDISVESQLGKGSTFTFYFPQEGFEKKG